MNDNWEFGTAINKFYDEWRNMKVLKPKYNLKKKLLTISDFDFLNPSKRKKSKKRK